LNEPIEGPNAPVKAGEQFAWPQPYRLWSLYDLMKQLPPYILLDLGEKIGEAWTIFHFISNDPETPLSADERKSLTATLTRLATIAHGLQMEISADALERAVKNPPETAREFETLINVVQTEVRKRQAFFIPPDRAKFFEKDDLLKEKTRDAFPSAASELREAANAYAVGLNTACVLHCSRAAEIGTRSLAKRLGCKFTQPLDEVMLHPMLEQCEKKIAEMKKLPAGARKTELLTFYSQAAFDFRLFKDAYRVHAAHARVSFTEPQALSILERTIEFFDALAAKLKEPKKKTA
jgi:hypothetical protein